MRFWIKDIEAQGEVEPTCQWCQAAIAELEYILDGNKLLEICRECHELMENPQ